MNHSKILFFALCLISGFGLAATVNAQIRSDVTLQAKIPYTFMVGNTRLPAGKYTVKVADDNDLHLLEIKSADGRTSVFFETIDAVSSETSGKTELVFERIGDAYFLSQVWLGENRSGNQLLESKIQQDAKAGDKSSAEKSSVTGEIGRTNQISGKETAVTRTHQPACSLLSSRLCMKD
jgi:hypothetical protein